MIFSPIRLVMKVGEKVKEEVDKEFYDLEQIQQKLIHLEMMYELDEIDEQAYQEAEIELLARYETAKKREMEQAQESLKRKE